LNEIPQTVSARPYYCGREKVATIQLSAVEFLSLRLFGSAANAYRIAAGPRRDMKNSVALFSKNEMSLTRTTMFFPASTAVGSRRLSQSGQIDVDLIYGTVSLYR
jgi:hypothetical protein